MSDREMNSKIGVGELRRMARDGDPIVAVTAYDFLFGRLADTAGCHIVLVGDSLGMTVLGYTTTLPVTLEESLHHTKAVVRGVSRAMVVGDMPFLTYDITQEEALRNAGRYLQEAGADAVKLEGGRAMADTIRRLVSAGIPVMGHIGLLPQNVLAEGGYRIHGKTEEEAKELEDDALAVQEAGAFAVVLEGLPAALAERITGSLTIPTIGIGAGAGCSGQIQVIHDILGLFDDFIPRHTKRYAELSTVVRQALGAYCDEVKRGVFPAEKHSS